MDNGAGSDNGDGGGGGDGGGDEGDGGGVNMRSMLDGCLQAIPSNSHDSPKRNSDTTGPLDFD